MSSIAAEKISEKPSPRWLLVVLLIGTTALHLFLALRYPLSEDETYYWEWSRHLDWGYYDQGPMISWWMRAFCSIFGDTELGVRAGAVAASLALLIVAFFTLRDLFGPRLAVWGAATLALTPLAMVGGFLFTYDILQVLFWALAIHALVRAVFFDSKWAWLGIGIWLGLGLLSKLTMAIFLPCMVLLLLTLPDKRRLLRAPSPWLAIVLGFLIYLPNLFWQASHGWITFEHVSTLSRSTQHKSALSRMGDFLGAQVAVVSPLLFIVCVLALVWSASRKVREEKAQSWTLWCFSAPILIWFLLSTLKAKVLGNWAACGWYGACLLAPVWASASAKRWGTLLAGLGLSAVLTTAALWPELPETIGLRIPADWRRQSDQMFGGPELARAVEKAKAELEAETGKPARIAANQYQEASRLGFYMSGQPQVYCFFVEARRNQYLIWNKQSPPHPGENFILVLDIPMRPEKERKGFTRLFEKIEDPLSPLEIRRSPGDKEPAHAYYIYKCYGYRGGPQN